MATLPLIDDTEHRLVDGLRRVRNLLEHAAGVEQADRDAEAGVVGDSDLAAPIIRRLVDVFGLTSFERDLLLLVAGVEMDTRIARLCATLHARPSDAFASFGLALAVLPEPHWSALTFTGPLRRYRLLTVGAGRTLTSSPLRIDERVLHFLTGTNSVEPQLSPLVREVALHAVEISAHQATVDRIVGLCRRVDVDWPVVQLWGDDPESQAHVAADAAAALGLDLHAIRADDLPNAPQDRSVFAELWAREARLLGSALLIENVSTATRRVTTEMAERIGPPVFISTGEPFELSTAYRAFEVAKPDAVERGKLWRSGLAGVVDPIDDTINVVAGQYRLGPAAISRLTSMVRDEVSTGSDPRVALASACRTRATHDLDGLAQRIVPAASWADIVLPADAIQTLHEVTAQVRHRATVYETWGFGYRHTRGLGISALFAGVSGTGKTMAAEVVAGELGLDLYRIDLSAVVSKYIGETEKNLRRVFDVADASGVILLFDEADALFGKRSEVRDSHDRYANVEISYLLQRMEAYRGLAILSTNMKQSLDSAFLRRLRFVIQFPFPDQATRHEIWQRMLPDSAPRGSIDFSKLARLNVAGGNIRNIAVNAAFTAAERGEVLSMPHLVHAARREYSKVNRTLTDSEIGGWT